MALPASAAHSISDGSLFPAHHVVGRASVDNAALGKRNCFIKITADETAGGSRMDREQLADLCRRLASIPTEGGHCADRELLKLVEKLEREAGAPDGQDDP